MGQLVVGKRYRVQLVFGVWLPSSNKPRWWPTIGPLHTDREFFHFEQEHYHIDVRFLQPRVNDAANRYYFGGGRVGGGWDTTGHHAADYAPLTKFTTLDGEWTDKPLVQQGWRKCHLSHWPSPQGWRVERTGAAWAMQEHFAGTALRGHVCPHRGVDLSATCPHNGVLECPAHGLMFERRGEQWVAKEPGPRLPRELRGGGEQHARW